MVTTAPESTRPTPSVPSELRVCEWTIAVDTREQAPWTFGQIVLGGKLLLVKRQVVTLETGDYSILGYEGSVCIERKSSEDAISSISSGNARFRREHERMHDIVLDGGFACVVVEGNLAAICDELDSPTSGRRVGSETIIGAAASWPMRYGTPWYFAGDRRRAELLGFKILYKWLEWRKSQAAS